MIDRRTLLLGMTAGLAGCHGAQPASGKPGDSAEPGEPHLAAGAAAARLLAAARTQLGVTRRYDSAYTTLAFPNGDVPREKGVCTDVVIRAYRDAFGIDAGPLGGEF